MKNDYFPPEIKVIKVAGQTVLCQSCSAEGFCMSEKSYNDDDFE